jgi:hypothetical protein
MGVAEGLDGARDQHKGPGPQCGAIPVGRFYRVVITKMFVSLLPLVTMTIFFFPALVRP